MSVRALMPVWRFAANSLLQMVDEELVYLANNLLDILLDKICLDMCIKSHFFQKELMDIALWLAVCEL